MKTLVCTACAVLMVCAAVCNRAAAQTAAEFQLLSDAGSAPAAARVPVTVNLTDTLLEDVLGEIARQAGLGISYRPNVPDLRRRVSLNVVAVPAAEALLRAVRGTDVELLIASHGRTLIARARVRSTGLAAVHGVVREAGTDRVLQHATVRIRGTTMQLLTGADGRFSFPRVPAGEHTVEASALGFMESSAVVTVDAAMPSALDLELRPIVIPLTDVVVTPGHFGIAYEKLQPSQAVTREQIETLPQLGEDIYRAVSRLPGVGANEFSAKLHVRGGNDESLLVLLDGLELIEPFHLKDFDGSLSILDIAAIGAVDLTTGGFGAEYGNRMTGVFDLRTTNLITPKPRSSIGLSVSNLRFMSQGSFDNQNGLWLVSARRGYLDILLKLAGQGNEADPRYHDVLAKLVYQLTPKHRIAARVLYAADAATLVDTDGAGALSSKYGSMYAWVTSDATLADWLDVRTQASVGQLDWNRDAEDLEPGEEFRVRDMRDLRLAGLRQDYTATLSDNALLKWGVDVRTARASYDYFKLQRIESVNNGTVSVRFDSITADIEPSGQQVGIYAAQRLRPWPALTFETGLRWDRQTHTRETQLSPRVNAALLLDARTTVRAAWGRYAQPHALHQLSVKDDELEFSGAERAQQVVLGIDRELGRGLRVRAEAYRRTESNLRPRYRNLDLTVEPIAEIEQDRVTIRPTDGSARGIELFLQRNLQRSSWSATYALAQAEDRVEGRSVPRPLDQRHTFYLDYMFAPAPAWRISAAWQYHTGWPSTSSSFRADTLQDGNVYISRDYEPYNSSRLPSYHRMDLRVTHTFDVPRGRLAVFLDVFNAYNRKNPQSYNYTLTYRNGLLDVNRAIQGMLPIMPTVGATWEF